MIGFIGSVFSPWYAWSGRANPENHVCINVATYGPGGRFTMTDRGQSALRQTRDQLQIGPSSMRWQDGQLIIDVNEIGALPMITPVRGQITVTPHAMTAVELPLTSDGAHIWRPFAPSCDIRVDLNGAGWQWDGHGYFDANFGTRALEQDFNTWTWGRFPLEGDRAACFYDAQRKDGSTLGVGVQIDADGQAREMELPPKARLKRSLWALSRDTRADAGYQPHQVQAMLDAPFYNRAAVRTQINGVETTGVYEALDLRRYARLKPMIAVRVPRRSHWSFD
ncbi:MAG: carotenoid 1,2-hydratase [Roseovarius sp.]